MRKGRKAIPSKIRALRGNPDKRKPNPNEPKPATGLARCPAYLSDDGKRAWARLAIVINGMGVGSRADGLALEILAEVHARLIKARKEIADEGITVASAQGVKKNPAVTVAVECERLISSFAAEFGLTPASRTRLSVPGGKEDKLEKRLRLATTG